MSTFGSAARRFLAAFLLLGLAAGCGDIGLGDVLVQADADAGGAADDGDGEREMKNALLDELRKALEEAEDLEDEDRDRLIRELEEADEALAIIKRQNREAIAEVNRQVRIKNAAAPDVVLLIGNDLAPGEIDAWTAAANDDEPNELEVAFVAKHDIGTPHMNELATQGVRFTNFYAGGPTDAATWWTLLAGRDTGHDGNVKSNDIPLSVGETSLAEMMWDGGYQTAFIGHWKLAQSGGPEEHGFEEMVAVVEASETPSAHPEHLLLNGTPVPFPADVADAGLDQLFVDEAIRYMRSHRRDKRPFLLVLSLSGPGEGELVGDAPAEWADWPNAAVNRADAGTSVRFGRGSRRRGVAGVESVREDEPARHGREHRTRGRGGGLPRQPRALPRREGHAARRGNAGAATRACTTSAGAACRRASVRTRGT